MQFHLRTIELHMYIVQHACNIQFSFCGFSIASHCTCACVCARFPSKLFSNSSLHCTAIYRVIPCNRLKGNLTHSSVWLRWDSFQSANGNVLLSSSSCVSWICYKKKKHITTFGTLRSFNSNYNPPFSRPFFLCLFVEFLLLVFALPSGSKTAILKHFNFYWALQTSTVLLSLHKRHAVNAHRQWCSIVAVAVVAPAVIAIVKFKFFFHISQRNCITNTIKMNCGRERREKKWEKCGKKCGYKWEERNKLK